jgi:3-oxoadipate CoA-transferase beta subunit
MDLAVGAKRLWVLMEHVTKKGQPRLVERCALPLTAPGVVKRVYTNLAVLEVSDRKFKVLDLAPGVTLKEIQNLTAAPVVS